MIIVTAKFPTINQDQEEEFRKWFDWSNQLLKDMREFPSRKLAKDIKGNYIAKVEFDSFDTFKVCIIATYIN
ncbi:MAG TPA: hypothetical protein VFV86_01550 [Nitrososphaeraceae archaeon]|nr:hypothetical protein [Nitrososphaeraceae archaeon]